VNYVEEYAKEVKRYLAEVRERVTEKLKGRDPAEQLWIALRHSLHAQREGLKACGPTCAVLSTYFASVVHRQWLHDYLSHRLDSAWRLGIFGTLGSGKSTYAFWLLAVWYLATRGYCRIHMPSVRGIYDVFPPVVDCKVDIMRERVPEVERAVAYDVRKLRELAEENYRALLAWQRPPFDVVLFDEAAASAFGSLKFFQNKRTYAIAGELAQLIRTTAPFVIVTAPDISMLSKYLRKAVSYVAYFAVDPLDPEVVNVRVDAVTEPRGWRRLELIEHLRDALLRPGPDSVKMPDWFYEEHTKWRVETIKQKFAMLEEAEEE